MYFHREPERILNNRGGRWSRREVYRSCFPEGTM